MKPIHDIISIKQSDNENTLTYRLSHPLARKSGKNAEMLKQWSSRKSIAKPFGGLQFATTDTQAKI